MRHQGNNYKFFHAHDSITFLWGKKSDFAMEIDLSRAFISKVFSFNIGLFFKARFMHFGKSEIKILLLQRACVKFVKRRNKDTKKYQHHFAALNKSRIFAFLHGILP